MHCPKMQDCQLMINEKFSAFLLESYQESDEEWNSLLNLNIELLDNQYQRIRAQSMLIVESDEKTECLNISQIPSWSY